MSGSNVYVAWHDSTFGGYPNYEILFKRSTDNGANWQPTQRLTNNAGMSEYPSVAASGSNVYVAWRDNTFNMEIFFKRSVDSGASWESTQRLTNNAGISESPSVAASGNNVSVAWDDNTFDSNYEIFFKRSAV